MITEVVEIEVKPGTESQFIAAIESSKSIFARADGCHGMELHHSIEHPQHFIMLIKWETVAHHMEGFRNSPDFASWRNALGEFFIGPPKLQHTETVVS